MTRVSPKSKGRPGKRTSFLGPVLITLTMNLALFALAPLLTRSEYQPPELIKPVAARIVPLAPEKVSDPLMPDLPDPPAPSIPTPETEPPPMPVPQLDRPPLPVPDTETEPPIEPEPVEIELDIQPQVAKVQLPMIKPKPKKKKKAPPPPPQPVYQEVQPTYSQPAAPSNTYQSSYSSGSHGSSSSGPAASRESRGVRVVSRSQPPYPPSARSRGIEGYVRVSISVGSSGQVTGASVVDSSPPGVFDSTVISTVYGWSFQPALRNGQPISATVTQTIRFTLR